MNTESLKRPQSIAVVIPCYKVKGQILSVIDRIGSECSNIYVIDDKCPENSGDWVKRHVTDPRVKIIYNAENMGVGGAVIAGYLAALEDGADVVVKIDGDGQMDPNLLLQFVTPIFRGDADYTKGNRFHSIYDVRTMPVVRRLGNAALSFLTKFSSGYWSVFDPTNGYTAIHAAAIRKLNFSNISKRYFFETDMLINLGGIRAVVVDVPMTAHYGEEESNLSIKAITGTFFVKNMKAIAKRVLYFYYLRDFNLASLNLLFAITLLSFGSIFGGVEWIASAQTGIPATTGAIMIPTLSIILGFQLLLFFLSYDINNEPNRPMLNTESGH